MTLSFVSTSNQENQSLSVPATQVNDYLEVGWTTEMQVTMYAPDGRTVVVSKTEVDAYQNVGWYLEPVVTMYAPDGRTTTVYKSEVSAYKNVGWYETQSEALATKKTTINSSTVNNSSSSSNPSADGNYYKTPTGKRYHFDPDCGGKNSFETTYNEAISSGLTPCAKCAK